jgi:hypothetical protein
MPFERGPRPSVISLASGLLRAVVSMLKRLGGRLRGKRTAATREALGKRKEPPIIDILSMNGIKPLLLKATPTERGLFLLFGYATNQINVLWKLITIATNETPENPIEQRGAAHRLR